MFYCYMLDLVDIYYLVLFSFFLSFILILEEWNIF